MACLFGKQEQKEMNHILNGFCKVFFFVVCFCGSIVVMNQVCYFLKEIFYGK